METVTLGHGGPAVSAIGLGCMGMSEFYGPADEAGGRASLHRARELGVTFLDTSDVYGRGENERLIGSVLADTGRAEFFVGTKFGAVRDPQTGTVLGIRGDPEYVRLACDASLHRLGHDYIDLYYLHVPDPKVPIEETTGAMAELVRAGKVRHLGLSNVSAEQLRAAHTVHPISAVQLEWSLFARAGEEAIVPACVELGVALVAYSPLGRGFLTGRLTSTQELTADDHRKAIPRYNGDNLASNLALLAPAHRIAAAKGVTTGQVALAWLRQHAAALGATVVPIPGTTRPDWLAENAASLRVELSAAELAELEPIAAAVLGSPSPPPPGAVRRELQNQN